MRAYRHGSCGVFALAVLTAVVGWSSEPCAIDESRSLHVPLAATGTVYAADAVATPGGACVALSGSTLTVGHRSDHDRSWRWTVLDTEPQFSSDVAIAARGDVVVIARPVGILIRIFSSTDGGRTFRAMEPITLVDFGYRSLVQDCAMTIDPKGRALLAFTRPTADSPSLGFVTRSDDQGATWTAPRIAFGGSMDIAHIDLASNDEGYYLVHQEHSERISMLRMRRSSDGDAWTDELLSRKEGGDLGASSLLALEHSAIVALDPMDGGPLMTWRRERTAWVVYALPKEPGWSRSLHLTRFADGRPGILRHLESGDLHILVSGDDGRGWMSLGTVPMRRGFLVEAIPGMTSLDLVWRRPGALVNEGRMMWFSAPWSETTLARLTPAPMDLDGNIAGGGEIHPDDHLPTPVPSLSDSPAL